MDPKISYILVDAVFLLLNFISIILVPSLVIGLVVGIFQAATSIQEMTLSFIPKIFVLFLTLVFFGSSMSQMWVNFTTNLLRVVMEI